MTLDDLQDKSIGILGFGMEGQSVARYLLKHGFMPMIFEQTEESAWNNSQQALVTEHALVVNSGTQYLDRLSECDIVFRSPGIADTVFRSALKPGAVVTTQTKFFFEHTPAPIIGITGTKGKGTTSLLIATILNAQQSLTGQIYLTGNIGKEQPLDFLDDLRPNDTVVYELSSFQLQDLDRSPHIGVCLMTTADHLDYHSDLTEYHQAKHAISKYQTDEDICISNIDYDASRAIGEMGGGEKWHVSRVHQPSRGAYIAGDTITFYGLANEPMSIDVSQRLLLGKHNMENIAAACLVALLLSVPAGTCAEVVASFIGLPHRLQLVGNHEGVRFYDDSIATTPETVMAAVDAFKDPVVLLVGGYDKGLNYNQLAKKLLDASHIKAVVLIGSVGEVIASELKAIGFDKPQFGPYNSFTEAVTQAMQQAVEGDVVLLSPGAASFDMFANYQERGNAFKELVNQ